MPLTNDDHAKRTHLTLACDNCGWTLGTSYFTETQIDKSANAIAMQHKNLTLWDSTVWAFIRHYSREHDVKLSQ